MKTKFIYNRGVAVATEENLRAAFAGESQANRRYLAFAKKAEEEGLAQVAKLFRAVAEAETVHAHRHLSVLGEVRSTKENLQAAIDGENYENTKMYPEFIEQAKADGNDEAVQSFGYANAVEKIHEQLYSKVLKKLQAGEEIEEKDYYVCQVCGYTAEGEAPAVCPVCGAAREKFKLIV